MDRPAREGDDRCLTGETGQQNKTIEEPSQKPKVQARYG